MTIRNAILALLFTVGASFAVPWLGVTFKKATFENHLALNVIGVHPESGCYAAGIVAGDQIIGVQGNPLIEMSQIQSAVSGYKAGRVIMIEIARDGKKQTLKVAFLKVTPSHGTAKEAPTVKRSASIALRIAMIKQF